MKFDFFDAADLTGNKIDERMEVFDKGLEAAESSIEATRQIIPWGSWAGGMIKNMDSERPLG